MARAQDIREGPMMPAQDFVSLVQWAEREIARPRSKSFEKAEEFEEALKALDAALAATVEYLDQLGPAGRPDKSKEDKLSKLWRAAAFAVRPFNPDLSERCFMKGQGWLDPSLWSDPEYEELRHCIKEMRNAVRQMIQNGPPGEVPEWFRKAAVAFAGATFISLLLLMAMPDLTPPKRIIFDAWLAFCLAASGTFIGGSAVASGNISLPILKESPVKFSSYGGIAIFILVFLILYAAHHYQ